MTKEISHKNIDPTVGALLNSDIENPVSGLGVYAASGGFKLTENTYAEGGYKTESNSTRDVVQEQPSPLDRYERFYREGAYGRLSKWERDKDDFARYLDTGPKLRRKGAEELLQKLREDVLNSMFINFIPENTKLEEIVFKDFYHLDMDEILGIVKANPASFAEDDLVPIFRYNAFIDRIVNILTFDNLPPFGKKLMEHINNTVHMVKAERKLDYLLGWAALIRMAKDLKAYDGNDQLVYVLSEPPYKEFNTRFVCRVINYIAPFLFEGSYPAEEIAVSLGLEYSIKTIKNYINSKFDEVEENFSGIIQRLFKLQPK